MINIHQPNICAHVVTNGYLVQWGKKNPDAKSAIRTLTLEAVCKTDRELVTAIRKAASDVSECHQK